MAGYYENEEEYAGPHRPAATQFDTMNMGPGPHRVAQFDTGNLGAAPHRVPQFETMNLGAPVRVEEPPKGNGRKPAAADYQGGYYADAAPPAGGSGQTPMNPALGTQSGAARGGGRMHTGLVIASLCLRAAAVVSLIIGIAVLASNQDTVAGVTVSVTSLSGTKYALAVAIIGVVYSIYETVSAAVRLAMGHLLLPGNLSLYVSYIGDQVVIALLLSGGSAAAATYKGLHDLNVVDGTSYCDILGNLCSQGAGATAMILLGFCFLAASLVISSFCFFKNKS